MDLNMGSLMWVLGKAEGKEGGGFLTTQNIIILVVVIIVLAGIIYWYRGRGK